MRKICEFKHEGILVTVTENVTRHRRMPRPHEMARQISRGRHPMEMVTEETTDWSVSSMRRHLGTIRQLPSGQYGTTADHRLFRTVQEAASAIASRFLKPKPPTSYTSSS